MGLHYMTRERVAEALPELQGQEPAQVAQVVADADALHAHLRNGELSGEQHCSEAALQEWFASQGWELDRGNLALSLLRTTGRVVPITLPNGDVVNEAGEEVPVSDMPPAPEAPEAGPAGPDLGEGQTIEGDGA